MKYSIKRRSWDPSSIAFCYAFGLAVLITVLPPVGYFYLNRSFLGGEIESEVRLSSLMISRLVSENPVMWTFQYERLHSQLNQFAHETVGTSAIYDLEGNKIVSLKPDFTDLASPLISREAPIYDSGREVGKVVVWRSLLGLLLDTAGLLIITLALVGGGSLLVSRGPLRKLRQNWESTVFLASHDALTSLPNRSAFLEKLEHYVQEAHKQGDPFALFYLDLDDFKVINDSFGHQAGDTLLKLVASRLRHHLRGDDFIARLGGDEFALLQSHVEHPSNAIALARRIEQAMKDEFNLGETTLAVRVSMGITIYGQHGTSPGELRRRADVALYQAKLYKDTCWAMYSSTASTDEALRPPLELDLQGALERGELQLHYQPQVDLTTGRIQGVEALLRWFHPERGLILPVDFLPLAEETGLIHAIGNWVIGTACRQALHWPDLTMAVNVSALQFYRGDLVTEVHRHLERTHLPPHRLQLEMTESVLLRDTQATITTLNQLRRTGVGIIVDDFGTGYSSLSYLHRFSLDKLKIDRSFIGDLNRSKEANMIVQAIIRLGHALCMKINAEGIERSEHAHLLTELGCDEGQGFLYGRAVPPDTIHDLLEQRITAERHEHHRTAGPMVH